MFEELNRKLVSGERVAGAYVFGGMPIMTESMAQCGFDVLWIDMEHTAIGVESLCANLIAAKAGGAPAWVRIPWNDPVRAKPVLDMGVDGIIFPYVCTAEEARLAVMSCAYPPEGIRGYGPLRALRYGGITQMDYVKKIFRKCHCVVQIEHIDAVKNLRDIARVEGIDAFIVGPNDLSGSVGRIGEVMHPELIGLYQEIAQVMKEFGKPFGVATGPDEKFLSLWRDLGASIFFAGSDVGFVHDGAMAVRGLFNRILSE